MPIPLSDIISFLLGESATISISKGTSKNLVSLFAKACSFNLSIASEALETNSRRNISFCVYNE